MQKHPIDLVEGQTELWCLLCPFGEFPGYVTHADGTRTDVVQICDNKAFEQLIKNFAPEVLIDFEHRSMVPKVDSDTTASGWAQELRIGKDGLEVRNKLTDVGADDIRNRRRRFLSGVWELDADGRPLILRSIGLTNTPNIHGLPVLNKESPALAAGNKERTQAMDPKQIAAALGLPETATAEQCLQAIKDLVAGNADLNKKVDEMNKSACANEADAVIAANKDRIADPVAFKQLFCANKDFALKALAATKVPEKTTTVANKTEGKRPDIATGGGVAENKLTAYRAMKPGKEKDAFLAANKAELVVLENAARDAASGK